jgi:DNA-binding MarR family transcriptional regulator
MSEKLSEKATTSSLVASNPKSRAWARLFVTSSLLFERVETALKAAKLPGLAWYDVLWVLENSEHGQLRSHELAERVVAARYNLTRLADRLEREGFISREPCAEDRRGAWCVITPAGRALRKRMWPIYEAQVNACFGDLITQEEAVIMDGALEKVRRHLRGET